MKPGLLLPGGLLLLLLSDTAFPAGTSLRRLQPTQATGMPAWEDFDDYGREAAEPDAEELQEELDDVNRLINSFRVATSEAEDRFEKYSIVERQADLYLKRSGLHYQIEQERYRDALERWKTGRQKKGEDPAGPVLDMEAARRDLYLAVDTLRGLVAGWPQMKRTDRALYHLVRTLCRIGNNNAGLYYKQFERNFPGSKYRSRMWLTMGECAFYQGQYEQAISWYQKVINGKNKGVYSWAVYKLGWAMALRQGEGEKVAAFREKAAAAFRLVLKVEEEKGRDRQYDLFEEALFDLAWTWAAAGKEAKARQYFRSMKRWDAYGAFLDRYASEMLARDKKEAALLAWKRTLALYPLRADLADVYQSIIDVEGLQGFHSDLLKDLRAWAKMNHEDSEWADAVDDDILDLSRQQLSWNLRNLATRYHEEGDQKKDAARWQLAASLYELYASKYPEEEFAGEARFYQASTLFQLNQFDASARVFAAVVAAEEEKETSPILKDAAYNRVLALSHFDEAQKYPPLPAVVQIKKPLPLPAVKRRLLSAIDAYLKSFPLEREGHPMRYTAAHMLLAYGHQEKAMERFEHMGMEYPDSEQGKNSLQTILAYYQEKRAWKSIIEKCNKFLESRSIVDQETRDLLRSAMAEAEKAAAAAGQPRRKR